jgi:hypothetical protein
MNAEIGTEATEIGTEAAQFSEKEYINGIFVAVRHIKVEEERGRACMPRRLFTVKNVEKSKYDICSIDRSVADQDLLGSAELARRGVILRLHLQDS